MQFLCLHGAIGNAQNFSIQLDAVERELEKDGTASLRFVDAMWKVEPPKGFENYFGIGPHYRWFDDGGLAQTSMMTKVRVLPTGDSPEDIMRALRTTEDGGSGINPAGDGHWRHRDRMLAYLYGILDENPDIQGIVGYSEGACIAASFLLDEANRQRLEGRPRQLKCAMFITGWPPISPDEKPVLSDEEGALSIDVPTLHLIGANDPYKCGSLALYNVCDEEQAILFDTGKGHTIPRAGPVIEELGDAIRDMISKSSLSHQRCD